MHLKNIYQERELSKNSTCKEFLPVQNVQSIANKSSIIYMLLQLDIEKANEQYGGFEVKRFDRSHDRFLIIDNKDLYHIGASLKDLGKKWFAFTKLDTSTSELIIKHIRK